MVAALYNPILLVVTFAILGIGFEWWQRRRGIDTYQCARCRYAVQGLTGPTCPECGNDLNSGGVLALGWQPWRQIGVRTVVLTILVLCAYVALARACPVRSTEIVMSKVSLSETFDPLWVVYARGRQWHPRNRAPRGVFPPAESFVIRGADWRAHELTLDAPDVARVEAWLPETGLGENDAAVLAATLDKVMRLGCNRDELFDLAERTQTQEPPRRGPFVALGLRRRMSFPGWPDLILAAAVLVIWIVLVHSLWTGPGRRRLRWVDLEAGRPTG